MAKFPALPIWTDALIADTGVLTPAEFGAYMRLLFAMWRFPGCKLPSDNAMLGRIIGDPHNWHRLKPKVLPFFDLGEDGFYRQRRLTREYEYVSRLAERSSSGGRAKALKYNRLDLARNVPNAVPDTCQNTAKPAAPTPIPTTTVIPNGIPVVVPPAAPAAPKATRWAASSAVPFDWLAIASATRVRHGLPDIDLKLEAERFANFWSAKAGKDGLKLDWRKTWINWALNAKGLGHGQGTGRPATAHEKFARAGLAIIAGLEGGGTGSQEGENGDPDTPSLPLLPP